MTDLKARLERLLEIEAAATEGLVEIAERADTFNLKVGKRCLARFQKKVGARTDAHAFAASRNALRPLVEAALAVRLLVRMAESMEFCPGCNADQGAPDPCEDYCSVRIARDALASLDAALDTRTQPERDAG